ncbi:MAG: hypothetical protein WCI78_01995 [Mycobacterium sp.]
MSIFLTPQLVEPVAGGLLGGITVDAGPTDEQLAVLQAVVAHLWKRPDIEVGQLTPIGPDALAATVEDPRIRRFLTGMLMTLEVCRHPETQTQVARIEEYAGAMGIAGEPLGVIRTWMRDGAEQANADHHRFQQENSAELEEPAFLNRTRKPDNLDPELAERLVKLADLPKGTLGRTLMTYYERFGLAIPGTQFSPSFVDAIFVSHDFTHAISGYAPTGQGEIALGAMEFAMNDSEGTWARFLSSLAIHEAGMSRLPTFEAKEATLTRPGAADLVGEAFDRGNRCTSDFARIDHMAMAEWPLAEVRAHFGVVPLSGYDWTLDE